MAFSSGKQVNTLVLDSGPIIKNEPSVSSLLAIAETLVAPPSVIAEIRDAVTRSRIETALLPFLSLRSPKPESLKLVKEFARKTGDLAVLSGTDLQVLALAYEIEVERNGGDWRLRRTPGQKRTNGPPPNRPSQVENQVSPENPIEPVVGSEGQGIENAGTDNVDTILPQQALDDKNTISTQEPVLQDVDIPSKKPDESSLEEASSDIARLQISTNPEAQLEQQDFSLANPSRELDNAQGSGNTKKSDNAQEPENTKESDNAQKSISSTSESEVADSDSDSDSEGWITPSNLRKQQIKDGSASLLETNEQKAIQVATITTDFAMQNVLLRMNLNLLSSSLQRVKHLKTFLLRCHGCFNTTKDMTKQFCPRCGKPTLTKVTCSTNQNGEVKLHLKKNMQWNIRGDRYSIPKPVPGSSNGRINQGGGGKGGGKGGWGQSLILAEDQIEYVRAMERQKRQKERDLMDEDSLPGILSGARSRIESRPRVGAGRSVNSRKR